MHHLIQHLFQWDTKQALSQITQLYQQQYYCIVSYVYGAVIVRNQLLYLDDKSHLTDWHQALFGSSLLLPDGAALRLWRRIAHRLWLITWIADLHNLNGTDFFPQLLEYYLAQWPLNLVCYGTYGWNLPTISWDIITAAGEYLQQHYGITWTYRQDIEYNNSSMDQRDRDAMAQACNPSYPTLMMVCRGVPKQELWSYRHREQLAKYHIIACNQWATIDYWAGREVRAPYIVRVLWLESLWRLASDPRKNRSKFWVSFRMMGEVWLLFVWYLRRFAKSL